MHVIRENSLILIYLGFFFCTCIALFNTYEIFQSFIRTKFGKHRLTRWRKRLVSMQTAYKNGKMNEKKVRKKFRSYLFYDNSLLFLDTVFEELLEDGEDKKTQEIINIWISELVDKYRNSPQMVVKFLAFLIGKYKCHSANAQELLMNLVEKGNLELCREGFYSICLLHNTGAVKRALRMLNRRELVLNRKILADALKDFFYSEQDVNEAGLADLKYMKREIILGVLDSFNNNLNDKFKDSMVDALRESSTDKEVRLTIIKYFGKYKYSLAHESLLWMLGQEEWEYAAIAAKALALYQGEKTAACLLERLSDSNWHVRSNCAMTLAALADETEIQEALESHDRYAREIMQYALAMKEGGKTYAVDSGNR